MTDIPDKYYEEADLLAFEVSPEPSWGIDDGEKQAYRSALARLCMERDELRQRVAELEAAAPKFKVGDWVNTPKGVGKVEGIFAWVRFADGFGTSYSLDSLTPTDPPISPEEAEMRAFEADMAKLGESASSAAFAIWKAGRDSKK